MPKSVFTDPHRALVDLLSDARKKAGLFQAELAARVGRDQTYVSRVESGERRIDLVEFYDLARAMGEDPTSLFADWVSRLPKGT